MAILMPASRAALAVLLLASGVPGASLEYQVKAAFLFQFARFVTWPADSAAGSGPVAICVFGQDPFGEVLDRTVAGKNIEGRPLVVRRPGHPDAAARCQIVFAGETDRTQLSSVLAAARRGTALTVGDTPAFQELGGIIRFVLEDNKVRFEVNLDAARKASLAVSSQLLRVARTVHGRAGGS